MEIIDYFQVNKTHFSKNESWEKLSIYLENACDFIDSLFELTFDRNFHVIRYESGLRPIQTHEILQSAMHTSHSMLLCAKYGSISDVYVLMRKLRDDLFFYLYIMSSSENNNILSSDDLSTQEKIINKWAQNALSDFTFIALLKSIIKSSNCRAISQKFNLDNELKKLGRILNNYTHGNGIFYYNKPYSRYEEDELHQLSHDTIYVLDYILIAFIFFLTLLCPICIMSSNYIDILDCSLDPEDGIQYEVAPFITDFLRKKSSLLGENALEYLRSKTIMDI